jgi:hypothetical protein
MYKISFFSQFTVHFFFRLSPVAQYHNTETTLENIISKRFSQVPLLVHFIDYFTSLVLRALSVLENQLNFF